MLNLSTHESVQKLPTAQELPTARLSAIPKLSTAQVTERLSVVMQRHLSVEQLNQYAQRRFALFLKLKTDAPPNQAHLQNIAKAYTAVCAHSWTLAFTDQALPDANQPQPATLSVETLNYAISKLSLLWAIGKWHHSQNAFFNEATGFSALQQKWRQPAIQSSLRQTTNELRRHPHGIWIDRYPTCWAYVIGHTMHQLLQWNHQLTSHQLREFLSLSA